MVKRKSMVPRLASPALSTHDAGVALTQVSKVFVVLHAEVVSHFVCQRVGRNSQVSVTVLHHTRGPGDTGGETEPA